MNFPSSSEPRKVIFIAWSLYTLSLVKNDFTPLMS